jgi:hypothetical protein
MRRPFVLFLSLSLVGCAAVFRGTTETVHIESNPEGADATKSSVKIGTTPTDLAVSRSKSTQIILTKPGYEERPVQVKTSINAGWLVLDIITCLPTFCIPLIIDGVTGAWMDVEKRYVATLKPTDATVAAASGSAAPSGASPTSAGASSAPTPSPPPDMSESERKATARAAYMEGIKLQETGNCPEALIRLETAQKLYSAPTHLLHIGQCQSALGKLVEASETYETLVRIPLTKESPEPFRVAQDTGKKDLAAIRPRIPTLRIQLTPAANTLSSLVVKLNGNAIPPEVLGIARPVNPGKYKVTVWAAGFKEASTDVDVGEGTAKAAELKLTK